MKASIVYRCMIVTVIITLAGLINPRPIRAQQPVGEGQAQLVMTVEGTDRLESPDTNDYLWLAGSSFKPRSSLIAYDYAGNGCITSLSGGDGLNQSFTAAFRVSNSSLIRGVRFYYNETSAQASRLSITSYDGAGSFIDHILIPSQGAAGAGSVYQALSTPYAVDTAARGFVLNWYPVVAGASMQLCGARLFYDRGDPAMAPVVTAEPSASSASLDARSAPQDPPAYDYHFLAGSSFSRRDSNTAYQ